MDARKRGEKIKQAMNSSLMATIVEDKMAAHVDALVEESRALRVLLCSTYAGAGAYMDDGELQDNRTFPPIDFLRMTPQEILETMNQRGLATLQASEQATAQTVNAVVTSTTEQEKQHGSKPEVR